MQPEEMPEVRKEENMNYVDGMDVLNLGLSAVLYDISTQTYYTPNTDSTTTLTETTEEPLENLPNEVFDINDEATQQLEKVIVEGGNE